MVSNYGLLPLKRISISFKDLDLKSWGLCQMLQEMLQMQDLNILTVQEEIQKFSTKYLSRLQSHPNIPASDLTNL